MWFGLGGLFAGLSFYTYMASRVVPIFFAFFLLYLLLLHRGELRNRWRGVLLFIAVYMVVAAPLALYLLGNPGVEYRLGEINQPLNALMQGQLRPVYDNALSIIAMFGIEGDPLWRQNVAYLPVFEPVVAAFFYIGVVVCLVKWRESRFVFVLLWLLTAAIPSIVTVDAPSSIRIINVLPVLTLFPLIGLEVIHFLSRLSTDSLKLSPKNARIAILIGLGAIFLFYIARTSWAAFSVWPQSDEVRFVWQEALTDIAAYLDENDDISAAAIGGWTPSSLDAPTMELAMKRNDAVLRYFDPGDGLIIPGYADPSYKDRDSRVIARPTELPMDPHLEEMLDHMGIETVEIGSFTLYELPESIIVRPEYSTDARYGDEIQFLGYDLLTTCAEEEDGSCELVTFWRIMADGEEPRHIFIHVVDEDGQIINQDDGLSTAAEHWRIGDVVLQRHSLESVFPDSRLRLGVYNPETGDRLRTQSSGEYIEFSFN
jgi:hypothetical protein